MSGSAKNRLLKRINDRSARIGIVGLGYVGLPLMLDFSDAGFQALGFDIDPRKVELINAGKTYFVHIPDSRVTAATERGMAATTQYRRAAETDVMILCLPTPLNRDRGPDLSFVIDSLEGILPFLHPGQLICLESTTYPGTTDEEIKPRIESRGVKVGDDVFLVFSPEREDPGNAQYSMRNTPKVIGGTTPACLEVGSALYASITERVVPVSSTKAAEMTKLLENIYRAVNIGLINEMKMVAERMDIDIWEVIDAAATKPYGFTPFYPGPGYGGHCIPIDPFYLTWKARTYGIETRLIEVAGDINTAMPAWVVDKTADALHALGKTLEGSQVLVLGVAYKKNVDDVRESPGIKILQTLKDRGAEAIYSDPFVPVLRRMREHNLMLTSVKLDEALLSRMDCVIVATDHDAFDYSFIQTNAKLIIDTRGRYRGNFENVVNS
ncbi:MAG: nucleotide sugar dehydrogenase [Halobacteriota archaeon]